MGKIACIRFENVKWYKVKELLGDDRRINAVVDVYEKYHGLLCKQAMLAIKDDRDFVYACWERIGNLFVQDLPDTFESLGKK